MQGHKARLTDLKTQSELNKNMFPLEYSGLYR